MNISQSLKLSVAIATTLALHAGANAQDSFSVKSDRDVRSNTASSIDSRRGGRSVPSVIVTVENSAPSRGAFQTPFWIGLHEGNFDIYDRNVPLGAEGLVAAPAVERLAEDGSTGPISDAFAQTQVGSPQATLVASSGPFAPGDVVSKTFNVDPLRDRYLSYASMVIPSNDAFIANGSPVAHELFDSRGRFVGQNFAVSGPEVLDAGTEVNDEVAANTAFINQAGPNIGVTENGNVVLHEGFALPGELAFPDGVLNTPALGFADFLAPNYRAATINVRYVDLGRVNRISSRLAASEEVSADIPASSGDGRAIMISANASKASIRIRTRNLTGPIEMAHLHLGARGTNGPVVVNLSGGIKSDTVIANLTAADVTGPLADNEDPFLSLLNEIAAGNVYINIHTAAFPAGEIRGQLFLR